MKCSKHGDADAVAICNKCKLVYCGSCVLSSNGKCFACDYPLSPITVNSPQMQRDEPEPDKVKSADAQKPWTVQAVASLYIKPTSTIRMLKGYDSVSDALRNICIAYFISILPVTVIAALVSMGFFAYGLRLQLMTFLIGALATLFVVLVLYLVLLIIFFIIFSIIIYVPAALMGGKATFPQQFHLLSYTLLALAPLYLLAQLSLILLIPNATLINLMNNIFMAALFIYYAFLQVLIIRETNEFKTPTAVASFIISLVLYAVLALIFLILQSPSTIAKFLKA